MELKRAVVGPLMSNAYVLSSGQGSATSEGVIIDAGGDAHKILSLAKGISIKCILLTHNHFDHTDAVMELKSALGVRCGAHLLDKIANLVDFNFNDGDIIHFGTASLKVIHTPGHTPGGCCFLVGNWLFSGDTIFKHGYGRTDFPGGDEELLFNSIKKILSLPPDTKIYPGHGPPTTVGEERKFYNIR